MGFPDDKRGESRRNLNLQVEYPDRQGYRIDVTESVSSRGIFIRSTQHHRVGERVRLSVSLPGFPDSIPLTGVVAHIREATADHARGVGLHIAQEEYFAKLREVMSSSEGRQFNLTTGPYSVLAALPRVRLATTPTPLHRAERLSKALGGPDIWLKRDDLTGFALGGNKVRKMELLAALALEQGADTLVVGAHSAASPRVRITSAAAARLGLDAVAVVADASKELAFSKLLGTKIRQLLASESSMDENVALCVAELVAAGKKPFGLTETEGSWLAACGYILASIELVTQLRRQHLSPEVLVCAVGSAETMSGLVVAQRWLDCSYDVHGVSVARTQQWCTERVATIASEICARLNIADTIPVDDIWINAEYARAQRGAAAGARSESESSGKAMAAVALVAQLEGIFLDPVFTGRAMAGLFDLIASGELGKRQSVVFLHTGGASTATLPQVR